jgi:8-oxo-dGTP pyrophosphatase MutT (NUDIX family)
MEKEFSTVVVLDENKENVLLILREDFHIWALPGGGLESGETPADAAIREAYEETGYEVKIDKYIDLNYMMFVTSIEDVSKLGKLWDRVQRPWR